MKQHQTQVESILKTHNAEWTELSGQELERVVDKWLGTFAQNVKRQTGDWVYQKTKWHGFSYDYEPATEGDEALNRYANTWPASYFVFDEEETWCLQCSSDKYPDLTSLGADVYVSHHNMKWTMVFTHEQPWDGPFFCEKDTAKSRK